jgi:multidrug resistance efflux pump
MTKETQKTSATSGPPNVPVNPPAIPLAALDQSFVLQMMLDLKASVAALKESVDSLKEQSKEHGAEIRQIGKDVHAAKVVGAFIVLAAGFLGFVINVLVEFLKKK